MKKGVSSPNSSRQTPSKHSTLDRRRRRSPSISLSSHHIWRARLNLCVRITRQHGRTLRRPTKRRQSTRPQGDTSSQRRKVFRRSSRKWLLLCPSCRSLTWTTFLNLLAAARSQHHWWHYPASYPAPPTISLVSHRPSCLVSAFISLHGATWPGSSTCINSQTHKLWVFIYILQW